MKTFRRCVQRYQGNRHIQSFTCLDQFPCMAFAQLTFRESLRDIEVCLRAHQDKLYHMGIRGGMSRNTLANANQRRDWRIYAEFAQAMIRIARPPHADEDLGLELDNTVYALDASTVDLCLSVFPWALFRSTKSAVKLHTLLDLRGNIPTFIHVSDGKMHDVNVLDILAPETARRVRQRIRTVLSWCEAHEYVDRNVAGECIEGALHNQRQKVEHMRSLPYADMPELVRALESGPGFLVNKLSLLFTILTATTGVEAREARRAEIDLGERMWRIPGSRMKMERDHDQPLSGAALEVLERARTFDDGSGLVFPSRFKRGKPLSNVAFMNLLRRIGYADRTTAHGFRATFRTWATECTDATQRAKKLSTAHKVGDAIEEAYDRAMVIDPRRELMERWGCYVMGRVYVDVLRRPSAPAAPARPPAPAPRALCVGQADLFGGR